MKLLSDWGFSREGWRRGNRGEYWVVAQAVLMVGFVLLPVYPEWYLPFGSMSVRLSIAVLLGLAAVLFFVGGLSSLGHSLTPLPYPKDDGELIQTGVYGVVRHPLYSGLVFAALGWAILQLSLLHFVGAIVFFLFFNAKASREETWLIEKFPDYVTYRQRVKKLLPGLY